MAAPGSITVIGAGQAGFWTVKTLRGAGFTGKITLIGDEPHLPYDRPPLSKAALTGQAALESVFYLRPEVFAQFDVTMMPSTTVGEIDRQAGRLRLSGNRSLPYERLVIATGARARRLTIPCDAGAPVYYLRSMDDCLRLKAVLAAKPDIIVIGGGFIGLEVAAAARKYGCRTVVLEAGERVMARVATPPVSRFFEQLHRQNDVAIHTRSAPERIAWDNRRCRVICADGAVLHADAVVAGIGSAPNDELAAAAGLETGNGVWVDEFARTSDPQISAAGDVTCHFNPRLGRRLRLETWLNAQNQAAVAARALLGPTQPHADVPWGWTDQFGSNLQTLGAPQNYDHCVIRENPETGSFSVFVLEDGRLTGVNTVNAVRDMAVARRLMAADTPLSADELADPAISLKSLLARESRP